MSDDVFSTVNNALGLFNNIDRLREQSTLKERGDAIAKALADNGGDFHALDPKLYSDRAGMAALASHVNTWSQTEQGKQTILQNQIKDAQYQTRLLGQYGSEIDKAMQSGNADLARSLMGSFSAQLRAPYRLTPDKDGGFDVMYTTPDGEQQSGKMSMQEAYGMLNNFRNNSKEFQKFTLLNGMAMNEMNTQLMMDVNNTVIGKGKDGKQVELVPVVGVGPNGVTQPMYSVPGSNQQFSREQLAEMGITDLMKATDARKEKMDNRRLDMEDRRIGLYGQALSLRGNKGRSPKASDMNAFNRMVDATLAQMGYGKTSKGYAKMNEYGEPVPVSLDDTDFADALSFAREQVAASFQQNLGIHFDTAVQSGQSQDGAANPQSGNTSWKNFR
ncbi:hypothetical protein LJE06_03575 [Bilophila wadsworthia]|uniref:hypothetical protein n=1 Tax=Bilophila wadsworthia TaxID=35833 RepID=UPI001D09F968|nr:hypothetical protein [Bilophila wadsworthia]MCB8570185.1 hypothetical protein [Bilophila wadsworthia]MCC2714204.1 hypothetical protein [Bilophila wadsworthia]